MRLYVIRDITAEQNSNVFEAKNDGVALRQLERLTSDSDYASEFELWCVGEHDAEADPTECIKVWRGALVRVKVSDVEVEDE